MFKFNFQFLFLITNIKCVHPLTQYSMNNILKCIFILYEHMIKNEFVTHLIITCVRSKRLLESRLKSSLRSVLISFFLRNLKRFYFRNQFILD